MARLIDSLAEHSGSRRVLLAILLSVAGLFLLGLATGVIASMIMKGHLPSRWWVMALPLLAGPLGAGALWASWRLADPPKSASGYEKRYWRMWMLMMAFGIPVGAVLAFSTPVDDLASLNPFTSAPIAAPLAILLALLVTGFFAAAMWLYHRTVDDHEERAYLWGSQIAYYFLIMALPAWWLLERGGIVGPITASVAFAAILISFLVQGAVWAWLKFR